MPPTVDADPAEVTELDDFVGSKGAKPLRGEPVSRGLGLGLSGELPHVSGPLPAATCWHISGVETNPSRSRCRLSGENSLSRELAGGDGKPLEAAGEVEREAPLCRSKGLLRLGVGACCAGERSSKGGGGNAPGWRLACSSPLPSSAGKGKRSCDGPCRPELIADSMPSASAEAPPSTGASRAPASAASVASPAGCPSVAAAAEATAEERRRDGGGGGGTGGVRR